MDSDIQKRMHRIERKLDILIGMALVALGTFGFDAVRAQLSGHYGWSNGLATAGALVAFAAIVWLVNSRFSDRA
ncbi:MAG TPA: hypothetical protein VJN94_05305 [Candidatus Binataceae bacterium]|nr:hypothetical protein [Candidatus Binataceae bacterium]